MVFKISNEEIIQSIKMVWSSGELNGTITPSGIIMKRAEEFPKNIKFQNYFSQLKFSETGGLKPGGRLYFSHMPEKKVKDNDLQIALTPVGLSKELDEVDYSKNSIKKEDESVIQLFETMFLHHLIERTV
ncbi:hypothetical protein P872_09600 [Rhodonellum psychrophilum GCM71 = DSM 17998]|uniref:Uncharacterized protein n=4 Tax=Cytophagaceae TaxID=89373 RepID=U5BLM3_9BACT|nr:hypothetical protein P872_09600 [Rhodonellum psychrophilum GCM71 = DSM 17998]SDZ40276.1 hypothetical protein SAMN05444412_11315 [Rhodonellum ikkaensis]